MTRRPLPAHAVLMLRGVGAHVLGETHTRNAQPVAKCEQFSRGNLLRGGKIMRTQRAADSMQSFSQSRRHTMHGEWRPACTKASCPVPGRCHRNHFSSETATLRTSRQVKVKASRATRAAAARGGTPRLERLQLRE